MQQHQVLQQLCMIAVNFSHVCIEFPRIRKRLISRDNHYNEEVCFLELNYCLCSGSKDNLGWATLPELQANFSRSRTNQVTHQHFLRFSLSAIGRDTLAVDISLYGWMDR